MNFERGALFVQGVPSLALEQLKYILPLMRLLSEYVRHELWLVLSTISSQYAMNNIRPNLRTPTFFYNLEVVLMVVCPTISGLYQSLSKSLAVRENDRSEINIIIIIAWAVDNHGTKKPSRILCRVVGVIPRGTVQISFEAIASIFQPFLELREGEAHVKVAPGAIGHCWTLGVPSYQGVAVCSRPCQWSEVPSFGPSMLFVTCTRTKLSCHVSIFACPRIMYLQCSHPN